MTTFQLYFCFQAPSVRVKMTVASGKKYFFQLNLKKLEEIYKIFRNDWISYQNYWYSCRCSFLQFCPDKTGRNMPKVMDFRHHVFRQYQLNKCICSHTLHKKLSMTIIFSSISDIFHSFFQFCPVSSSFVRTKLEEMGFSHFFRVSPEDIGFSRKNPNPGHVTCCLWRKRLRIWV